jgi:hypothetical protein
MLKTKEDNKISRNICYYLGNKDYKQRLNMETAVGYYHPDKQGYLTVYLIRPLFF